jgi:hypothetical protein
VAAAEAVEVTVGRSASVATIVALVLAGCGRGGPSTSASDTATGSAVTVPDGAPAGPGSKGTASMSPTEVVQQHYAREFKVPASAVNVVVADHIKAPGITVFTASIDPSALGRDASRTGIVDAGSVYVEVEAMSRIARAWSYGESRPVAAAEFAAAMGYLHSTARTTQAIASAGTLRTFKLTAYPKQAAAADLPAETTVDGHPAVVYSLMGDLHFQVITAIVKPGFEVELRSQPIAAE